MKIPIIETATITEQFKKIKEEYHEAKIEFEKMGNYAERNAVEATQNLQHEALDLLTATMNLIEMLKIPPEIKKEHQEKMKRYETEKGYKIIKWLKIESAIDEEIRREI